MYEKTRVTAGNQELGLLGNGGEAGGRRRVGTDRRVRGVRERERERRGEVGWRAQVGWGDGPWVRENGPKRKDFDP